jgi:protein CWC15
MNKLLIHIFFHLQEDERRAEEEQIRMENILKGNPLLQDKYAASAEAKTGDMKVKRRWDDDVVFKNCSRYIFFKCIILSVTFSPYNLPVITKKLNNSYYHSRAEPEKKEKQFINDSLRSDFHRKFMDKYIK